MDTNEEMEGEKVESYTAGVPQEGQEIDPNVQKKVDGYISVLMNLLHSKKTRENVMKVVTSSEDPYMSIPQAAVSVNDMGVNLMKQSGVDVDFGTQLAASAYLIGDLIELGYASGTFEELSEEDIAGIYEDALQTVIERGLADGSIDPIQLQLDVEPMMNDNQRRAGNELANQTGTPMEPNQQAMIEQQVQGRMASKEQRAAKSQARQTAIKGREAGNEMIGRQG